MAHFPDLTPAILPSYNLSILPHQLSPYWISGYFTIYCTFDCVIDTTSELKNKIYNKAVPYFTFSRSGEKELMRLLSIYFSGNLKFRDNNRVDVVVSGTSSCMVVTRLFLAYPLSAPKTVNP